MVASETLCEKLINVKMLFKQGLKWNDWNLRLEHTEQKKNNLQKISAGQTDHPLSREFWFPHKRYTQKNTLNDGGMHIPLKIHTAVYD